LCLFHPVVQEEAEAEAQMRAVLAAVAQAGLQALVLEPNADAGRAGILRVIREMKETMRLAVRAHIPRSLFASGLACADVVVGNSSSGIIEAATFGTPVVNIGSRQNLRERNANVIDAPATVEAIAAALGAALAHGRYPSANIYGDDRADLRIATLLAELPLDASVLAKINAY
jgi:GDP/UDP-N,N'-diacetylbacillosamine 2-epimerase (hydrolysing)